MNFKEFCIVGAKVIAALGIGVAAFFGLGKLTSKSGQNSQTNSPQSQALAPKEPAGLGVVTELRNVQDTCGKIFGVAQSLSTLADNVFRIFNPGFNGMGMGQGNNGMNNCPPGFTRISPNIILSNGCGSGRGYNNQYYF